MIQDLEPGARRDAAPPAPVAARRHVVDPAAGETGEVVVRAGVAVEAVKNILHLLMTTTGGVGELANFLIGSSLVVPAALLYRYKRTKTMALAGLLIGVVTMAAAGALANYYLLLPFYSTFFPLEAVIAMSAKANPAIKDMGSLILYGIVPFNLLKGLVLSILTLAVYKRISRVLHN